MCRAVLKDAEVSRDIGRSKRLYELPSDVLESGFERFKVGQERGGGVELQFKPRLSGPVAYKV